MTEINRRIAGAAVVAVLVFVAAATGRAAPRVEVGPNRLVVQVNGIVCSFCAHGAEKSLRQLQCLDPTMFGQDGVLVEIDTHQITLALKPKQKLPVLAIYDKIRKAGYDPVTMHVRLSGIATRSGKTISFKTDAGQRFVLEGKLAGSLPVGQSVELQGHLDVKAMQVAAGQAPHVTVDRKL